MAKPGCCITGRLSNGRLPWSVPSIALIGVAVSTYAAYEQAQTQEKFQKYNAKVAENQAAGERMRARVAADQQREAHRRLIANQRATYGVSGVDVASGSPLLVIADSAKQAELDAQIILAGGEARGIGFETQAGLSRFQGRQAATAGYVNAGSTLLSGVASTAAPAMPATRAPRPPHQRPLGLRLLHRHPLNAHSHPANRLAARTGRAAGADARPIGGGIHCHGPRPGARAGVRDDWQGGSRLQQVNQKLTEQDMKFDEKVKLSELKDLLAQEDIRMREEGVEPDALAPTFQQRATQRARELGGQLKYAASAKEFEVDAGKLITLETIKQRYRGADVKEARIGVTAAIKNQENVNDAIFGETPRPATRPLSRSSSVSAGLISTKVWSQEKATSEIQQMLSQIEMGRMRVAAQNPEQRPLVIDHLLNGKRRHTRSARSSTLPNP